MEGQAMDNDDTVKSRIQGKESKEERLLKAWIDVSMAIRNERFVSELTYNESLVCRILSADADSGGKGVTATELCKYTQMKKSQMNRTLKTLEERGLIKRRQSDSDHRCQLITVNLGRMSDFKEQHSRIIAFVGSIMEKLGASKTQKVTVALEDMLSAVREVTAELPEH